MKDLILHYTENCTNIDDLIFPIKPKEEKPKPNNPEFEKNVDEKDEKLVEVIRLGFRLLRLA